jgi:predicted nucleic acid-binding protein
MTKLIAFDTSIFVAHFEQQAEHPLELIAGLVEDVDAGRVRLLLPTVVIAELFMNPGNVTPIQAFLDSPSVLVAELNEKAARLAGEIRKDCHASKRFKPRTPDTLIVATAQEFGADTLYTVDEPLVKLNKSDKVTIKICPPAGQSTFLIG